MEWLTFFTFAGTAGDLQIQKLNIIEHPVSSFATSCNEVSYMRWLMTSRILFFIVLWSSRSRN